MSNKVKLPKSVAQALDYFYKGYSDGANWMILAEIMRADEPDRKMSNTTYVLLTYAKESESNFNTLLQALVNDYEVEQTPEDKVRDMFNTITPEGWKFTGDANDPVYIERSAIRNTCTLLGHKIDGINT